MATNLPLSPNGNVVMLTKGITVGGFWPAPSATYPAYTVAAEEQPPAVDEQGNLAVRGPVVTDEGGFRDPFPGAALSADWTPVIGAGGSIAVAGSVVTIGSGTTANSRTYIYRSADFMPFVLSVYLTLTARAAASSGLDFFFGVFNNIDPTLATEYAQWVFRGTGGNTASECLSRSHAGAGGEEGTGTNVAATSTTTAGFRSISLDGEGAIFRDGATSLPAPTVRTTRSQQQPDLYTELFVIMGFVNAAVVSATPVTASIDTVFFKNLDRLVVNTSF